ncbi:MAG TPA: TlpA disulfide reductase family protein, partial [Candidatus Binataceae bacterium]|nr:TlpA disulfide reductase family protein [Candidatus Binataceae bacterium]
MLAALLLFAASYELSHPRTLPVLTGGSQQNGEGNAPVPAGDVASEFKLEDAFSGQTVSLSSLRGKVVFLNVWATWCGPCVEEFPDFVTMNHMYRDRGFEFVSISAD